VRPVVLTVTKEEPVTIIETPDAARLEQFVFRAVEARP
jgi:hypothetical protein